MSERQWIQAALAAEGFDPGPAGGQFGPKTRRAIQAWQQANGFAALGELTSGQAEVLLAGVASLEPFGPNWSVIANQPCQVWNEGAGDIYDPFMWPGSCVDGKASGKGRLTNPAEPNHWVYEGRMSARKLHGRGTLTWPIWANGGGMTCEWREHKNIVESCTPH